MQGSNNTLVAAGSTVLLPVRFFPLTHTHSPSGRSLSLPLGKDACTVVVVLLFTIRDVEESQLVHGWEASDCCIALQTQKRGRQQQQLPCMCFVFLPFDYKLRVLKKINKESIRNGGVGFFFNPFSFFFFFVDCLLVAMTTEGGLWRVVLNHGPLRMSKVFQVRRRGRRRGFGVFSPVRATSTAARPLEAPLIDWGPLKRKEGKVEEENHIERGGKRIFRMIATSITFFSTPFWRSHRLPGDAATCSLFFFFSYLPSPFPRREKIPRIQFPTDIYDDCRRVECSVIVPVQFFLFPLHSRYPLCQWWCFI